MEMGFTYKGIHCRNFDLHYIPAPNEIRNRMEEYDISSVKPAGRHGGYYVHSTVNERVFELDCYFENMSDKTYSELLEWQRRDDGGELIFDDRPHVIYDVQPTKAIKPTVYMKRGDNGLYLSGKLTISFTAYQPFGRIVVDRTYGNVINSDAWIDTGILENEKIPESKIGSEEKTVSGTKVSIDNALSQSVKQLVSYIEPRQEGSGSPSFDNIRPINGWDTVTVINETTGEEIITLLPETIHIGECDHTNGVVKNYGTVFTFTGEEGFIQNATGGYYYMSSVGAESISACTHLIPNVSEQGGIMLSGLQLRFYVISKYSTVNKWKEYLAAQYAAGTPLQIAQRTRIPETIDVQKTNMNMSQGVNNIYSNTGDTLITYACMNNEVLFYNAGTEVAPAIIRVSGVADDLLITNITNDTSCRIIGLSAGVIPEDSWLEINGETGQVYTVIGDEKRQSYEYHDLGYVKLEPCTPIKRDVLVSYSEGSRLITSSSGVFFGIKVGQYIYIEKEWHYIGRIVDENTIEINTAMKNSGVDIADIVTMNHIVLEGGESLSRFEIECIERTR